jgi:acetyl-CoA carboxylase biotin carboxyl carrier protein
MDVKDLKKLLDAVAEADIAELTLETGDYKLTVKRGAETVQVVSQVPQQVSAPQPAASAAQLPAASTPETPVAPQTEAPEPQSQLLEITAPIVGTFYAAPAPDSPDYVQVGDHVNAGQVLCIIEAMKLMNEIEADAAGIVKEILVKNEEPVEYGQVLFRIDPS